MTVSRTLFVFVVLIVATISTAIAQNSPEDGESMAIFGGNGGGPFKLICKGGFLAGVTVRSGAWVDAVGVICSTGQRSVTGGNGGGAARDYTCPAGNRVSTIKYGFTRDGNKPKYLDYVEVHCEGGATHCFDSGDGCWDKHPNPGPYNGYGLTNVSFCRDNQQVNGLVGRSGAFVDALALQCYPARPASPPSSNTAPGTSSPPCCWITQADSSGAIYTSHHCDNSCSRQ